MFLFEGGACDYLGVIECWHYREIWWKVPNILIAFEGDFFCIIEY